MDFIKTINYLERKLKDILKEKKTIDAVIKEKEEELGKIEKGNMELFVSCRTDIDNNVRKRRMVIADEHVVRNLLDYLKETHR